MGQASLPVDHVGQPFQAVNRPAGKPVPQRATIYSRALSHRICRSVGDLRGLVGVKGCASVDARASTTGRDACPTIKKELQQEEVAGVQFMLHLTQVGERWDLLAWRYCAHPMVHAAIIQANPTIPP